MAASGIRAWDGTGGRRRNGSAAGGQRRHLGQNGLHVGIELRSSIRAQSLIERVDVGDALANAFIIHEKENLIPGDRAGETAAELVEPQGLFRQARSPGIRFSFS